MKRFLMTVIAGVVIGAGAFPAQAQMDWLTPHLDAQRANNLNRHNQRMAERRKRKANRPVTVRPAKVQVDGKPLTGTVPTVKKNGTTFVALRGIFDLLGAKVTVNRQEGFAMAERGASKWRIPLQGSQATVNGAPVTLKPSETPFVHKGATMIPLHLVEAGMGEPARPAPQRNNNRITIISW